MRNVNVVAFMLSSLAVGVIFACGSPPAPDTSATAPSSTPSTPSTATPDLAGGDAGGSAMSTGDAGGASASADAGPTKEQQCDQLQTDAQSELDAERIKVNKCKTDADCVTVKGRACQFICTNGAIPKAAQKEWDKELASVKDGSCKKWADMGCKKPDAKPPTCADDKKKAFCDKGQCSLK